MTGQRSQITAAIAALINLVFVLAKTFGISLPDDLQPAINIILVALFGVFIADKFQRMGDKK